MSARVLGMHRRLDERRPARLGDGGVVAVDVAVADRRDRTPELVVVLGLEDADQRVVHRLRHRRVQPGVLRHVATRLPAPPTAPRRGRSPAASTPRSARSRSARRCAGCRCGRPSCAPRCTRRPRRCWRARAAQRAGTGPRSSSARACAAATGAPQASPSARRRRRSCADGTFPVSRRHRRRARPGLRPRPARRPRRPPSCRPVGQAGQRCLVRRLDAGLLRRHQPGERGAVRRGDGGIDGGRVDGSAPGGRSHRVARPRSRRRRPPSARSP